MGNIAHYIGKQTLFTYDGSSQLAIKAYMKRFGLFLYFLNLIYDQHVGYR